MTHGLKSWPGTFDAVASGLKKHEVRKADRPYTVGDSVILKKFVPEVVESGLVRDQDGNVCGQFTGDQLLRRISYITKAGTWGLPDDICILSLETEEEYKRRQK